MYPKLCVCVCVCVGGGGVNQHITYVLFYLCIIIKEHTQKHAHTYTHIQTPTHSDTYTL